MFGIAPSGNRRAPTPFFRKVWGRAVVADIGSGSAGVAILSGQAPARIEVSRRTVLSQEERSKEQTASAVVTALSESAKKVLEQQKGAGAIEHVYAVIHAPWVRSKTLRIVKKFPHEELVKNETISALAREALEGEKEFNHANLIEASVIRTELNGYPTANPVGKHAHTILVSILVSECDAAIKKNVEETLKRTFSSGKVTTRSSIGAILSVMEKRSDSHADYLIVDMTSQATSLAAVYRSTPREHAVVAEGVRTILKRIAGEKLPEETKSLMRMVARGHCENKACKEVKAGMARVEPELIKAFGEAFVTLATRRRIPNALVLSVEPDVAEWLSGFFSRIDFAQFTITTQPFSVEVLTSEFLRPLVELKDEKAQRVSDKAVVDTGLLVDAALIGKEVGA